MTNTMHNSVTCTSRASRNWILYYLKGELEKSNLEVDRDYVPMDVYIDPWTMKKHFQGSLTKSD